MQLNFTTCLPQAGLKELVEYMEIVDNVDNNQVMFYSAFLPLSPARLFPRIGLSCHSCYKFWT
jgi:hypothetical protein